MATEKRCGCVCHKMPGILIIALGLTFLLKNLGIYDDQTNNMIWPAIVMLIGFVKTCSSFCKCCSSGSCKKD